MKSPMGYDLREAMAYADEENVEGMQAIVAWLYNEAAPGSAWGSAERFKAWIEERT